MNSASSLSWLDWLTENNLRRDAFIIDTVLWYFRSFSPAMLKTYVNVLLVETKWTIRQGHTCASSRLANKRQGFRRNNNICDDCLLITYDCCEGRKMVKMILTTWCQSWCWPPANLLSCSLLGCYWGQGSQAIQRPARQTSSEVPEQIQAASTALLYCTVLLWCEYYSRLDLAWARFELLHYIWRRTQLISL